MPRKRKVAIPKENLEPKKVVAPVKVVEQQIIPSADELSVIKIIINSQKNDTNHKKGLIELQKLYKKVCSAR